ncbi:HlyD family secretion protein [Pararhodobacter sp. CCB-MM2]|uniref:HlyD family secretion protein n=1 Tax=Pararhodobacter sp. CCB-MM2 TaxID=1786003 RepID=UPI00082F6F65|nr:HlyD family efflux transporter periplasmic adaptor subunit [Pararhodobacter sp. CCB-MM2]
MKSFRLLLSVVLIVAALWVIIGEQMSGASADAVLNAPVITVRAGTAGDLTLTERPFGARVQAGEVLGSITDPRVDQIRLNDLQMELALAQAETARIAADLTATEAVHAALLDRTAIFHTERLAEIRTRLDHARLRLALLEGGEVPDALQQRLADLLDDAGDRLPQEPLITPLVIDHARERVAVLEIALRAAEQGVFLGDGYNDSPNAEQRATELESVLSGLRNALVEAQAREAAYTQRLNRERVRVNGLTGGEIVAPVTGAYWEILEASGVNVQRGDPLLRLVDCGSSIVTLSVTERIYNSLRVGQGATFRLAGNNDVYRGTVARLAGSGAATIYNHLAVAPSERHLERFDVTLLVPALTADPQLGCAIGRTGRVFFDDRPLDWLRGLFD